EHFRGERVREHVTFHAALAGIATGGAVRIYGSPWLVDFGVNPLVRIGLAALTLFLISSAGQAALRTLNQDGEEEVERFVEIWRRNALGLLKACVGSALVAHSATLISRTIGWETVLLTGPAMYLVYRTYIL